MEEDGGNDNVEDGRLVMEEDGVAMMMSKMVQDLGNSDKICWRLVANSGFLRCFVQGLVTALGAIRSSLIDPNGNLSDWNRGDPCTSNWTGVLCYNTTMRDGYLHATTDYESIRKFISRAWPLVLYANIVSQNISVQNVYHLSCNLVPLSLLILLRDVMWNQISGSIPKEVGNITSLELLLLNGNQLTGPLPDEIGYLPNLERIQIDQNQISGPIPKSFAKLNKTKHFHMNNNSLSGQIPPELSALPNLVHMLLDNNNLSGYLPPELANLPRLLILQLDNNHFDGATIPDSYGNMSKLLKLSLRNCSLQGPIPDLSRIPHLAYMSLLNNSLNGSVPATIWQNRTFNGNASLIVNLQNNMLSNISGSVSVPANVTVRLQGNPICLNTNLVQFCGPQNENKTVSHTPSATNSSDDCKVQSCTYEYAPNSPCFCAAPLIVGYRLKSPAFRDFEPYWVPFERCLTTDLELNPFQLEIVSVSWEEGYRLRMNLKIFPVYVDNTSSHFFNTTEVQRIRSMFTGWRIDDTEIFGPYELLDFPLRDPYIDVHIKCLFDEIPVRNVVSWTTMIIGFAQEWKIDLCLELYHRMRNSTAKRNEYTSTAKRNEYTLTSLLSACTGAMVIPSSTSKSGISKGALAGIVVGTVAGALILSAVVSLLIWRLHMNKYTAVSKRRRLSKITIKIDGVKDFSYQEMALATNNFDASSQVGQGGYGKVYKGILADGTVVAIKRALEGSLQGEKEFLTEIELLSRLHHRNLVSLLGYCDEEGEQMLVYEFMSNGTLRDHLSGAAKEPPGFAMRLRIALGSSKGILYLHTEADPPIFHRDVKASNILLDSKFTAKVADFGLSRLAPVPDIQGMMPSHVSTVVKGTPGYVDPEYFLTHKLTDKSDVYSLGVVFLELLTGMHPISHGKNIVREVKVAYRFGMIFSVIDKKMGSYPSDCVERFVNLALKCCQDETDNRPSMSEVVRELESIWLMMLESDTKTSESLIANPGKVVTPPLSSSDLKNHAPYVSGDISGNDLISGVISTITPR
ncbi:hypothetical protein TEA_002446 [Camellia sinensis var. sinensis]|uniref:non-specific serine/threonine protein kinase n=1 Tax=Camellia sinensis var. sinensis TaxID=542762 RepID=A0A4S4DBF2_CAMSN|nr:hypothetical protein TEA_002446 [Camellia sinensis var. sinensis]